MRCASHFGSGRWLTTESRITFNGHGAASAAAVCTIMATNTTPKAARYGRTSSRINPNKRLPPGTPRKPGDERTQIDAEESSGESSKRRFRIDYYDERFKSDSQPRALA